MPELVGALVVATGFLALVVRDLLVAHGAAVRSLERRARGDEPPVQERTTP
jgi:hypothetical protein